MASIPNKPVFKCSHELYPYNGKPLKYRISFYIKLFWLRNVADSLKDRIRRNFQPIVLSFLFFSISFVL